MLRLTFFSKQHDSGTHVMSMIVKYMSVNGATLQYISIHYFETLVLRKFVYIWKFPYASTLKKQDILARNHVSHSLF